MPQIQAAKKALRVSSRRRAVNDSWRRKLRNSLHGLRDAMGAGDVTQIQAAWLVAQKTIDRAARARILHHRTAARKKSRLQRAVSALVKSKS